MSQKLFDLAKAELGKTPEQKAVDALQEKVERNQQEFSNDLFNAKQAARDAKKHLTALDVNPSARANDIIAAEDAVKVAEKNVAQIEAIIARRF